MKVGDIVKYCGSWITHGTTIGVVLWVNDEGGTVKVCRSNECDIKWWVTSGCEVISESR